MTENRHAIIAFFHPGSSLWSYTELQPNVGMELNHQHVLHWSDVLNALTDEEQRKLACVSRHISKYARLHIVQTELEGEEYAKCDACITSCSELFQSFVTGHGQFDWNSRHHFGWCGQSCPCCRATTGDYNGACESCMDWRSLWAVSRNFRKTMKRKG